jgi:hypothetical protein
MRSLAARFAGKHKRELAEKLRNLGEELTESVQPAEIAIGVLPLQSLPTPDDWREEGL